MSLPPSFVFQLAGVHGKGVFLLYSVDTVKIDLRSENGKWQCLTLKANHHNEQKKILFSLSSIAPTGRGSWIHLFETWSVIIKEHFHAESLTKPPDVAVHLGKD